MNYSKTFHSDVNLYMIVEHMRGCIIHIDTAVYIM